LLDGLALFCEWSKGGHRDTIAKWIAADLCGSAASDKTRRSAIRYLRAASAFVAIICAANVACAQEARSDASAATNLPASPTQGEASVAAEGFEDNPTESADWQSRIAAARQRHDDWLACLAARRSKCSQTPTPDPTEALLNDETLVDGDIVSTPKGLRVFHGQPNAPHSWADFK
jgi:hypothetical protein